MSDSSPPPFLEACARRAPSRRPIWIMRQAGRYLPEYRALREQYGFMTLMKTPDLAVEVTLQPIRRFDLDAAILFADIMTPVEGMGFDLEFAPGPVIANPVRTPADLDRLRTAEPEETVPFVLEAVRTLRSELPPHVPLIGFAGAPFTLFCYVVQGGSSKSFMVPRGFLRRHPEAARALLERLADVQLAYLRAQHAAGAQALMLFDSWSGLLGPETFAELVLPSVRRIRQGLADTGVPFIYFPFGGSTLLETLRGEPFDVVGIDWRLPLSRARATLGGDVALQGNLDPAALFADRAGLTRAARRVIDEAGAHPGHIFNLGHGIEPDVDPDQVAHLIDVVHDPSD